MRLSLLLSTVLVAVLLVSGSALAQWSDNFDSYLNGSALHGQGGWQGWGNNPAATAYVTNVQRRSLPHSADIRPTSDIVQQFTGVSAGQWVMTGWSYVPAGISGEQYFILLNTYPASVNNNWSTEFLLDMTLNVVKDYDNPNSPTLPLIRNQWVEVRVEIDFAADQQKVFYNGALLTQESWTGGAAPGGALRLQALDLFSNAAPSIYWDDLVLQRAGATAVEPASWGQIKGVFSR